MAEGYYVWDLTHDEAKLAMVNFYASLPVMLFGPFAGLVADYMDRKLAMGGALFIAAIGASILAFGSVGGWLQYWHFLAIAAVNGMVQTIEAPSRQAVVRTVVGDEDLPYAIPAQAMTFNISRIVGPAIGAIVAVAWGVQGCFFFNAVSYFALIGAVFMIRADLRPKRKEHGTITDLLLDGIRYTFREKGLRTLFLMESATSVFGMFYLSLLPAIASAKVGPDLPALGYCSTSVGIGAFSGLILLSMLSSKPYRPLLTRIAMISMALALVLMAFVPKGPLIFGVLILAGMSSIMQFNTTNTLFQMLSPENLRGRVISMHMWAISGLAPLGIYVFGHIAQAYGLDRAMMIGGGLLAAAAAVAWTARRNVVDPSQLAPAAA